MTPRTQTKRCVNAESQPCSWRGTCGRRGLLGGSARGDGRGPAARLSYLPLTRHLHSKLTFEGREIGEQSQVTGSVLLDSAVCVLPLVLLMPH